MIFHLSWGVKCELQFSNSLDETFCWRGQSSPECRTFYRADPPRKIIDCSAWKTLAATHWSLLGYVLKRANYKRYETSCRDFNGV